MKYLLVALFTCISTLIFSKQDSLYVCAIFQNEARFLNEWIHFHLEQGADKIYLYNNKSEDDFMPRISKYIRSGQVVLRYWPYGNDLEHWNTTQCKAYMDCIKHVKKKVEWVACIDTDEFLFSPTGKKLPEVLKDYQGIDAIGVNWVMYGSNNIEYLGDAWLTRNMTMRSELSDPVNRHVKSIVRPQSVTGCINPHYFGLYPGKIMTNEAKDSMEGPFHDNSVNILRINHYWSRDLSFFRNEKLKRQAKWWNSTEEALKMEASFNLIYDPILSDSRCTNSPRKRRSST